MPDKPLYTNTVRSWSESNPLPARKVQVRHAKSVIENAPADSEVWVYGGVYDPGSETTIPQDVTVRFIGAWFEPSGNYDGFFVSRGADLYVKALTDGTYTSNVVNVDGTRAGGAYRLNEGTEVTVDVTHYGVGQSGVTLNLVTGANQSITVGNTFRVWSQDAGIGIRADTTAGGFLNDAHFTVAIEGAQTLIEKQAGAGTWQSVIRGLLQPDGIATDYGIRNKGGAKMPTFIGQFWDPGSCNTASLAGENVEVVCLGLDADAFLGTTDGSFQQFVTSYENNEVQYYNGQEDNAYIIRFDNNLMLFRANDGTGEIDILSLLPTGVIRPAASGQFQLFPEDLSAREGVDGELAVNDGTTGTEGLFRYEATAANWVRVEDNATTI